MLLCGLLQHHSGFSVMLEQEIQMPS